jgi:hypothetical protein
MLARRFLWVITGLILLVLAAAVSYRLFAPDLMRTVFVPNVEFKAEKAPVGVDYSSAKSWLARPDFAGDPSHWLPPGVSPGAPPRALVFFVHPTSFLDRNRWNAPLDDEEALNLARLFVRSQASAFNNVGAVWAPKYRQATVGAFLTRKPDAARAIDLAYADVRAAFDRFIAEAPGDRPIILAGHSQGSLHLTRLLHDRVAGKPLARRIAAAYIVGWPISTTADLPELGLPACEKPEDSGCILSWQSFAEPADPEQISEVYEASAGPTGLPRAGTPILCIDPLTGTRDGAAASTANKGTLIPNADFTKAILEPGRVPARCDARGLLLIGEDPPALPRYVLPGNNYHVFDYALFWANIRADAERRLDRFLAR